MLYCYYILCCCVTNHIKPLQAQWHKTTYNIQISNNQIYNKKSKHKHNFKKNAKYQHKIKSPRHLTDDKLFHFHRPMQSYRQHQQPAAAHLHRRLHASSSPCPHWPVSPLWQSKPTGLATEDATSGLRRQQTKLFWSRPGRFQPFGRWKDRPSTSCWAPSAPSCDLTQWRPPHQCTAARDRRQSPALPEPTCPSQCGRMKPGQTSEVAAVTGQTFHRTSLCLHSCTLDVNVACYGTWKTFTTNMITKTLKAKTSKKKLPVIGLHWHMTC